MEKLWENTVDLPKFDKFKGNSKTDVLIIGGGMAGILTAYLLDKCGVDYILVESDRICSGTTSKTTAKITAQHGLIYDKLINKFGIVTAKKYLDANLKAFKMYRQICENIDCDFEIKDSYIYTRTDPAAIKREATALKRLGADAEYVTGKILPIKTKAAVCLKHQAQFNPLKFVAEISKGLHIFEQSPVRELKGNLAILPNGSITAQMIVVATHFPFINKHGSYFIKLYQQRSYVIAYENIPEIHGMYLDSAENGFSLRRYGDLTLIGGGGHRTGKKGGGYEKIEKFVNSVWKNATPKYHFATQDCMSLDKIPYIGRYSKRTNNMLVATGFNKWGMTSSMVAAKILCDKITGVKNPYESIFKPSRSIWHRQLLTNLTETVNNLLTFNKKRCPHLGCALEWNSTEHTWDCPCHGSRFTENGKLIEGPATGDLNS